MLRGLVLIALAAISWGTTGVVATVLVARAGAGPLLVGTVRMWVAAAVLALGTWLATGSLALARGDRWRAVAMGACMAAYQATYFTAVTLIGIAVAALVAICSAPLLVAELASLLLGDRLSARGRTALGLGVVGTALLVAGPRAVVDLSPRFAGGALLALGAGLAYALYVVVAKASLARSAPLPLAAATFAAAALFMTPTLAWETAPLMQVALGWPWLLYLGAVATAGAYALYTTGLSHVPASAAAIASLLEPLTATLLGVALFGERLGAAGVGGAALLFSAIGLLLFDQARPAWARRERGERDGISGAGPRSAGRPRG